jgi:hypothetical protein
MRMFLRISQAKRSDELICSYLVTIVEIHGLVFCFFCGRVSHTYIDARNVFCEHQYIVVPCFSKCY